MNATPFDCHRTFSRNGRDIAFADEVHGRLAERIRVAEEQLADEVQPLDRIVTARLGETARRPVVAAGQQDDGFARGIEDLLARVVERIPARLRFAFEVAIVDDERRVPFTSDSVEHVLKRCFAGRFVKTIRSDCECQ
jgi:hypothetical protein